MKIKHSNPQWWLKLGENKKKYNPQYWPLQLPLPVRWAPLWSSDIPPPICVWELYLCDIFKQKRLTLKIVVATVRKIWKSTHGHSSCPRAGVWEFYLSDIWPKSLISKIGLVVVVLEWYLTNKSDIKDRTCGGGSPCEQRDPRAASLVFGFGFGCEMCIGAITHLVRRERYSPCERPTGSLWYLVFGIN